jgi:hypothetical protein
MKNQTSAGRALLRVKLRGNSWAVTTGGSARSRMTSVADFDLRIDPSPFMDESLTSRRRRLAVTEIAANTADGSR